jgi:hypothetical protein
VLDEYTRQSRCIHVDRKINARKVRSIMSRPPASFRPSLDLLYTLNQYINPSRLTV